jgi:hypothetical protein
VARKANGDDSPNERDLALELRQLALVDRVLGLEAENARLKKACDEEERLRAELQAVYASRTWALGSAMKRVVHPFGARRAR